MTDTMNTSTTATTCTRGPIESIDIERPLEAPIVNREAASPRVAEQPTALRQPATPAVTAPGATSIVRRMMWSLAGLLQLAPSPSQHALAQVGGLDRSPRG